MAQNKTKQGKTNVYLWYNIVIFNFNLKNGVIKAEPGECGQADF